MRRSRPGPDTGRSGRGYLDGSGSIELAGLPPASTSTVSLDVDGRPAGCVRLTTTATLGPELSRFATLSDIHLGLDAFGLRGKIVEGDPATPSRSDRAGAVAAPSTSGPPPDAHWGASTCSSRATWSTVPPGGVGWLPASPAAPSGDGDDRQPRTNHAGLVSPLTGQLSADVV
jgi:hypothetical protein